jgi:hypothetical protein
VANYRIIVNGVQPGRSVDEVVEALSRMSMKSPAFLHQLLDGRKVVIKRTFEVQKAVKYRRALEKIGCVCTIEADMTAPEAPAITVDFTNSPDSPDIRREVREIEYANKPRMDWRRLRSYLGPGEWILIGVLLLFAVYYGYKALV